MSWLLLQPLDRDKSVDTLDHIMSDCTYLVTSNLPEDILGDQGTLEDVANGVTYAGDDITDNFIMSSSG